MTSSSPSLTVTAAPLNRAIRVLGWTVKTWFTIAVIGQLLFATYVALFYGGAVAAGDLSRWNEQLTPGYQEGHTMNNTVIAAHLFVAIIIMLGGPLQFITLVRRRYPVFHRWNGRTYVALTTLGGITGFYMLMKQGIADVSVSHLAMSVEALLIVIAGVLVWWFAASRKMEQHEAWAVRLFLVASGVWFFRVFIMAWLVTLGGPVGLDPETFTGPLIDVLSWAHYLLPLAVYECYLLARRIGTMTSLYAMASLMVVSILVTVVGVFGATMGMWLPSM